MMFKTMMMLGTGAIALGMSTVAAAQDMGARADAPFSGFYVGASGGYDIQSNDVGSRINFDRNLDGTFNGPTDGVVTSTGANAFSTGFCNGRARDSVRGSTACESDRDGASYYARGGFDIQRGMLVAGIYGEFGKSEVRDFVSAYSTTPANYVMSRQLDWEASIRGRVGAAFGSGMFYATGGAGYAKIKNRFTTTNTANAFADNGNDEEFGFIVGGGVEKFLTDRISVGMEYTYHDYKDNDYRVNVTRGTAPATNPFVLAPNTAGTDFARSDQNFRWHSLRGTVAFHF